MAELKYKRVLLKLSGEALAGEKQIGIDPHTVSKICAEIADVVDMGLEVALVIGGGNIFRGLSASAEGMDRSSADYMGMLATVLNALAVQDALERPAIPPACFRPSPCRKSANPMSAAAPCGIWKRAA